MFRGWVFIGRDVIAHPFNVQILLNYMTDVLVSFANKKLMKNKDLNAASTLQIYKSNVRPIVT